MLVPARMVWADLLVDRESVNLALETLADLEVIELGQPDTAAPSFPVVLQPDEESLARLTALERQLQQFKDFLPAATPVRPQSTLSRAPTAVAPAREWKVEGPKSGTHSGSFSFSFSPSYSPARTLARFRRSGREAAFS